MSFKIGFQGIRGAYSEQAAIEYFGESNTLKDYAEFSQVFTAIELGELDYAVVPLENSLAGSIHENYDNLLKSNVWIRAEYLLRIDHCLLSNSHLTDVEKVYSHPQALAQCSKYIKSHNLKAQAFYDTAGAARLVSEKKNEKWAAIASRRAATDYELKILAQSIQNEINNFTRFVIIEKSSSKTRKKDWSGESKTSIVFSLKNIPGGLHKALSVFAIRDIDLTKIESRPLPGSPWKYLFYLDFNGYFEDEKVKRSLDHIQEITESFKLLGSYELHRK